MINPFKNIEVKHIGTSHPSVDERTEGLVIAHITDVHHGRWVKTGHVEELVALVNRRNPDIVVLTGDYVGYSKRDIYPCVGAFAGLEAPTFATLGNHDHWACTDTCQRAFADFGIPLLSNESRRVSTAGGHQLRVVGVDDSFTNNHDVERAFVDVGDDEFVLVLSHVPELGPELAEAGGHMVLSGHTHGLQFNIPGVADRIARRFGMVYTEGSYTFDTAMLYVSKGLGSASWPRRYRAAPELTFFELTSGHEPAMSLAHQEIVTVKKPRRPLRQRIRGVLTRGSSAAS